MKKGLLTTTALVAAMTASSAFAGDVSLSLGGFLRAGGGVGPVTETHDAGKDFFSIFDSEIHFNGKGTLDNGITIATRIELEGHSDGDQIDEQWIQIKSQFGTVMIGGNDDAAYNISGSGKPGFLCTGAWDGCYAFVPGGIVGTIGGKDSAGIHYYTPNIAGFEAGISWQPSLADLPATTDKTTDNSRDRLAIGAAYSNSFGDVSFGIDGGYIHTDEEHDSGGADESAYAIGANIGYSGFTLEGRWEHASDYDNTAGTDMDRFGGGLTYVTGPWTFQGSAVYEDVDANGTADDSEAFTAVAGIAYELGDGVDVGGVVQYGDVDYGAGGGQDNDGFGGVLLLGVSF